jgi:chromosome segregation ATPase
VDRETETRLAELEAQIAELESKTRKDLAAVEVEVQKIDLRHENALLRQALQTSSENYAAHVKRVELILNEKVENLRRSNDSLSGSIQTEVRNTQTEARTAIASLNGEIRETVQRSMAGFREAAEATRAQYVKLANRRETIDIVVIVVAVVTVVIAVNAVTGIPFDWLRHLVFKR